MKDAWPRDTSTPMYRPSAIRAGQRALKDAEQRRKNQLNQEAQDRLDRIKELDCKVKKLNALVVEAELELAKCKRVNDEKQDEIAKLRAKIESLNVNIKSQAKGTAMLGAPASMTHAQRIIIAIAQKHQITIAELKGRRRQAHLVAARQEASYILTHDLGLSYPMVGRLLGGKDHTTILHAVNQYKKLNGGAK